MRFEISLVVSQQQVMPLTSAGSIGRPGPGHSPACSPGGGGAAAGRPRNSALDTSIAKFCASAGFIGLLIGARLPGSIVTSKPFALPHFPLTVMQPFRCIFLLWSLLTRVAFAAASDEL